jgi:hypothetical protein
MVRRTALLTTMLALGVGAAAPLTAQSSGLDKTLAPGTWIGGGVGFSTIQSPADFANGLGFNFVGGWTRENGLGLAGGLLFTFHPRPGTRLNRYTTMSYVTLRAGPRYTLNPRARTTPFIQLHALATKRSYSDRDTNADRSRFGAGGGGIIGVMGATSKVRVEFGVVLDYYSFGDEKSDGVIVDEDFAPAFNGRQLSLTLSFLFPLSTY